MRIKCFHSLAQFHMLCFYMFEVQSLVSHPQQQLGSNLEISIAFKTHFLLDDFMKKCSWSSQNAELKYIHLFQLPVLLLHCHMLACSSTEDWIKVSNCLLPFFSIYEDICIVSTEKALKPTKEDWQPFHLFKICYPFTFNTKKHLVLPFGKSLSLLFSASYSSPKPHGVILQENLSNLIN